MSFPQFLLYAAWAASMTLVMVLIAHNVYYSRDDSKTTGLLFNLFSAMSMHSIVTVIIINIIGYP